MTPPMPMPTSKDWRILWILPALMAFAAVAIAWDFFLLPSSFSEALFRHRLGAAGEASRDEIRLSELAPFAWEEVCSHHPYDGEFKHPRYGRSYRAPMNAARDGVWVLLFLDKDGSPTYISGSCARGGAHIGDFDCLPRGNAVLRLGRAGSCPSFAPGPETTGTRASPGEPPPAKAAETLRSRS